MNTNPPTPSLPEMHVSHPALTPLPLGLPSNSRIAVDIESEGVQKWLQSFQGLHKYPWYVWAVLWAFAFMCGAVIGFLGYRYQLSCAVDRAGYVAKTAVCTDQQAYALIPMSVDVRNLEERLSSLKQQLSACQANVAPK